MRRRLIFSVALCAALSGPSLALAETEVEPLPADNADESAPVADAPLENPAVEQPVETGAKLYEAIRSGQWLVALGAGLMIIIAGIRWLLGTVISWDWATTKLGGYVISLATSLLVAVGIGLYSGAGLSWGLFVGAVGLAWTAAGGRKKFKDAVRGLIGDS